MKWVMPFLGFVLIGEFITANRRSFEYANATSGIDYAITVVQIFFYGYLFYQLSQSSFLRKFIVFFTGSIAALLVVAFVIYQIDPGRTINNLAIAGFVLTVIAVIYIHSLFVNDDHITLIEEPGFWIAIGVSSFFSGTSLAFSLHNVIQEKNLTVSGILLYNFITRVLCVILYLSISIAIILCKKNTKTSWQQY